MMCTENLSLYQGSQTGLVGGWGGLLRFLRGLLFSFANDKLTTGSTPDPQGTPRDRGSLPVATQERLVFEQCLQTCLILQLLDGSNTNTVFSISADFSQLQWAGVFSPSTTQPEGAGRSATPPSGHPQCQQCSLSRPAPSPCWGLHPSVSRASPGSVSAPGSLAAPPSPALLCSLSSICQ